MSKRADLIAAALCAALSLGAFAQEEPDLKGPARYTPRSAIFTCELPAGDWHAFEEEDAMGIAVHILGPDGPDGVYRAGIDVRWMEKGSPGFVPFKKFIDDMRRSDKETSRSATPLRLLRVSGTAARTFEITETRRLPSDQLPSFESAIHHYVAAIPSGESYYILKLSSTRDDYLDYRGLFVRFLKSFKTIGYK